MTPAQVRAVIEKLKTDAVISAADPGDGSWRAPDYYAGEANGLTQAARILTEALAESEAAPVWCEKFGPKGYACVIRHALGTPHESRNAAGDVIDTWGP